MAFLMGLAPPSSIQRPILSWHFSLVALWLLSRLWWPAWLMCSKKPPSCSSERLWCPFCCLLTAKKWFNIRSVHPFIRLVFVTYHLLITATPITLATFILFHQALIMSIYLFQGFWILKNLDNPTNEKTKNTTKKKCKWKMRISWLYQSKDWIDGLTWLDLNGIATNHSKQI